MIHDMGPPVIPAIQKNAYFSQKSSASSIETIVRSQRVSLAFDPVAAVGFIAPDILSLRASALVGLLCQAQRLRRRWPLAQAARLSGGMARVALGESAVHFCSQPLFPAANSRAR